jgi:hypothetical protein
VARLASRNWQRVEVVRGRLNAGLRERLIEFWTTHGALAESQARERLDDVICICRDGDGGIVGANSAYGDLAPLVGRRFWIYRRFLAPTAEESADAAMLAAARTELERTFTAKAGEPVGLCVLVADPVMVERRPEALWRVGERSAEAPWPGDDLLFAGYTPAGVQVRISYFEDARI